MTKSFNKYASSFIKYRLCPRLSEYSGEKNEQMSLTLKNLSNSRKSKYETIFLDY